MNNNFINFIFIITVIYLIYMIYHEYIYHKHNKDDYILSPSDFENNLDKYTDSKLFNEYMKMPEPDKLFINDFINYIVLKHKLGKPKFNKKLSGIKEHVLLSALTSNISTFSILGVIMALRQNIAHHITATLI